MTDTDRVQIVHLDKESIGPDIDFVLPQTDHLWTSYDHTPAELVIPRLADADIVVLNKVQITRAHLEALPKLKYIVLTATGFDKVDIQACHEHNVTVSNARGYARHTVPEHTIALIFALRRSLVGYHLDVHNGVWQNSRQFCFFGHPVSDLHGSTFGLVGSGVIGSEVGRIASALGMDVLVADRKGASAASAGRVTFDEMLARADIISLHCPLTPDTANLIAAPEFAVMNKAPLIINTSRGGLVNEADLIDALDSGQVSGAALDVLTQEPPSDDHIIMQNLNRPNLLVTPHIAWASHQAMQTLWHQVIDHIDKFVAGTPQNTL